MSEENNQSSGQGNEASGDEARNVVSYESHQKLLGEKKSLQSKFDELNAKLAEASSKLDAAETEKLKAREDQSEYIKKLEADLEKTKNEFSDKHKKIAATKIHDAFKLAAQKEGCEFVDDLGVLYANKLKDIKFKNADTFEVDSDSISSIISEAKQSKPHLFSKPAGSHDDVNFRRSQPVNIDDASVDDLKSQLRSSLEKAKN